MTVINQFGPTMVLTALTKSDTTYYDPPLEAVYCGGTGALALEVDGKPAPIIYAGIAAQGIVQNVGRIRRVKSTGTTATLMVGIGAGATATS